MPSRATGVSPRVGLSTYRERAAWGVWNQVVDLLPASYADSVLHAGGVPLLLPPADAAAADVALDGVHGLLVAGGADVDPANYGAQRDVHTGAPRPDRDAWESALLRAALARDLPVLAVCRGMQLLNVVLGGDLVQHLPDVVGTHVHCPTVGAHGRHSVRVAGRTALAEVFGAQAEVATHHHQGVGRLGAGLQAVAWAYDGLVEAVEMRGQCWVLGVQWHPEVFAGEDLFDAFIAACAAAALR